jgi:hypothetical protein
MPGAAEYSRSAVWDRWVNAVRKGRADRKTINIPA